MAVNSYKQDEHSTDVGKMKTLMRLFSYLLDYKKEILAVLAIMAFCVFVSLVNPLIMENAIDKHISTGDFPGLAKLIGIAVVLNVIMILFVKLRMLIMAKVCNSILVTIRQQLYTHIQTLDFSFFDSLPIWSVEGSDTAPPVLGQALSPVRQTMPPCPYSSGKSPQSLLQEKPRCFLRMLP